MIKLLKKFIKNEDGVTAVEFSLLALPYFTLMLAVIELSIMYASASLLEGATNSAARAIRTGQIQQAEAGDSETLIREKICNYATVLINCNDVQIEVVQMDSFADFSSNGAQYDADGNLESQGIDPAGSGEINLIRVAYRYEMMTPFVGPLLVGPSNSRLFMSTFVQQNEPYDFDGAG